MNEETNKSNRQEQVPEDVRLHEHKPMTAAQNVVLTIKVLMAAAILLAAIMALDRFSG